MIPVQLQPEPESFSEQVKDAGLEFLDQIPQPTSKQWGGNEYWRRALPDMRTSYHKTCAYCAHWIPHGTGSHSIDHFIPKSKQPEFAYEWSNFRYVSARFNSRKGTKEILDPFELQSETFTIDFRSFFIHPNPALSAEQQKIAEETIRILKLNLDDDLVEERQEWFMQYYSKEIPFSHLKKYFPFIASEISRQQITVAI